MNKELLKLYSQNIKIPNVEMLKAEIPKTGIPMAAEGGEPGEGSCL